MKNNLFFVFALLNVANGCEELNGVDDNLANSPAVTTESASTTISSDRQQNGQQTDRRRCDDLRLFHEELQLRRIKGLRDHILSSLNLNKPPSHNVTRPSDAMLEKIRIGSSMQMQSDSSLLHSLRTNKTPNNSGQQRQYAKQTSTMVAEIRKKVLFSTKDAPDKNLSIDTQRTYFHIVNMREYDVRNATLYFYIQQPQQDSQQTVYQFEVHVYRYLDGSQLNLYPLISKQFKHELRGGYWVQLNVTDLVHEWVKSPNKNFGIMLKAHYKGEDLVNRTVDDWNRTSQIFLHVEFNEEPIRRIVHHNHDDICESDRVEEKCCRYRLQVDFEAMGWDWIIAPKRYDAYYCAGTCPFHYKPSSPHTHLTQQLDSLLPRNHRYRSIGPCCTPKEYQELKIIYISDAGTVHERRVPDMMVVRCGCA